MNQHSAIEENFDNQEGLFPIRTVSSITGVNSITLRAWERRYGLIKPLRTPKGHRLYSQQDIDLIQQVVTLLDKGISIGQVKQHLENSLSTLEVTGKQPEDPWSIYQQRMVNAIERFEPNTLDAIYNETLSLYPADLVTVHLITPLLKTLGKRWEKAQGSVAEEHFFNAYLRNKLGARFHHHTAKTNGPKILAACLPGEHHEIGLMLFCLSAIDHGYQLVYLGADTPLEELVIPAKKTACNAILLSGSVTLLDDRLEPKLRTLTQQVKVPVFVGGQVSINYRDAIVNCGATPLGKDASQALRNMDEHLKIKQHS